MLSVCSDVFVPGVTLLPLLPHKRSNDHDKKATERLKADDASGKGVRGVERRA